ncbi:Conserved oligomeric Golgi complex subunit 2 [Smittium mucronatum]|uniref:Conserved oligomeric Golgi complex subunit 2 n=1 Tax=Smittium mucronatum TaxID=133383 RepID=A0A1R0H797_9FUNG|nr:Conserved oligomeric Golgi complex subunit 2 [Smittium mucronatum]
MNKALQRLDRVIPANDAIMNSFVSSDIAKGLGRSAQDMMKLDYLVKKNPDLPFAIKTQQKIALISTRLNRILDQVFENLLKTWTELATDLSKENSDDFKKSPTPSLKNFNDDFIQCIWTYFLVEDPKRAEQLVKDFLVAPKIKKAVEKAGLKRGEISIDPATFSTILDLVLADMLVYVRPLQSLIESNLNNTNIDFIVNSVWIEFSSQTLSSMPTLFVPGMPQRFCQNYIRAEVFINDFINKLCVSIHSSQLLCTSDSFNKWWKKWHLPAYFAIRQRQMIESITQYSNTPANSKNPTKPNTRVVFSRSLYVLWDKKDYIKPLSHRWWKLSLQIMIKYISIFDEKIESSISLASSYFQTSTNNQSQSFNLNKFTKNIESSLGNLTSVTSSLYDANQLIAFFIFVSIFKMMPLVYDTDYSVFLSSVGLSNFLLFPLQNSESQIKDYNETLYSQGFIAKNPQLFNMRSLMKSLEIFYSPKEDSQSRTNPLYEDGESIIPVLKSIDHIDQMVQNKIDSHIICLSQSLIKMCNSCIDSIKQTPSIYRHTNLNMPTSFSEYIQYSFNPLKIILNRLYTYFPNPKKLEKEVKLDVSKSLPDAKIIESKPIPGISVNDLGKLVVLVVQGSINHLKNTVDDLLKNIEKTNASLQRLRNSNYIKNNNNGVSNLNSDDNKIKRQIYYDVLKFEEVLTTGFESRLSENSMMKTIYPKDFSEYLNSYVQGAINRSSQSTDYVVNREILKVEAKPSSFPSATSSTPKLDNNSDVLESSDLIEILVKINPDFSPEFKTLKSTVLGFAPQ